MAVASKEQPPKRRYAFADGSSGVATGPGGVTLELPGETDDPAFIEWADGLAANKDHPLVSTDKPKEA